MILWMIGTAAMVAVRLAVLVLAWVKFGPGAVVLLGSELVALGLGIRNAFVAREVDRSWIGLLVPVAYALGLGVWPNAEGVSVDAVLVMVASTALSWWALWALGARFTVGGSSWVNLCERGPYRFVRHPQALARVLMVFAAMLVCRGSWAFLSLMLALVLIAVVVAVEERFLSRFPEYRSYRLRVPGAILPVARLAVRGRAHQSE